MCRQRIPRGAGASADLIARRHGGRRLSRAALPPGSTLDCRLPLCYPFPIWGRAGVQGAAPACRAGTTRERKSRMQQRPNLLSLRGSLGRTLVARSRLMIDKHHARFCGACCLSLKSLGLELGTNEKSPQRPRCRKFAQSPGGCVDRWDASSRIREPGRSCRTSRPRARRT